MAVKKKDATETPRTADEHFNKLSGLIATVKDDNLTQFGEIKKEFGNMDGRLNDHYKRIRILERDKDRREAVEDYKKEHPEAVRAVEQNGSGKINAELVKAIMQLLLVIGVLTAAIIALKAK